MRTYSQIQYQERNVIHKMIYSGYSQSKIADRLCRSTSSISREISRNKTKGYNAKEAQSQTNQRRIQKRRKLDTNGYLCLLVCTMLMHGDSPELIAVQLKEMYPDDIMMHISHESIYQWLYDNEKEYKLCRFLYTSPKKRQNRQLSYKKRAIDSKKKNIRERPIEANDKTEIGHYEGDLIESAGKDRYILTLVDRMSSFVHTVLLPSKDAETTCRAIIEAFEEVPQKYIKTITFDNGNEFAKYETIEQELKCRVYFANPYCAWQRGLNEHINGRFRYYLPKKKSFSHIDDYDLEVITDTINNRLRKSRGWLAPSAIYSVALQT
jgi:transposase, IS30 family